jgi:crossover junction endodeoxyribonuclease RusA
MISVELPWPSADLSPNARLSWPQVARAKKQAKNYAWGVTKALMGPLGIRSGAMIGPFQVRIVFHPEIQRTRDLDNMQARMKAALDGIALGLGVNDSEFRPVSEFGKMKTPACVVVTITPALVSLPVLNTIS